VPGTRRLGVIKLTHTNVYWAVNKTKQRIVVSGLYWPTMTSDVNKYCGSCETRQLRARQRRSDKVEREEIHLSKQPEYRIYRTY